MFKEVVLHAEVTLSLTVRTDSKEKAISRAESEARDAMRYGLDDTQFEIVHIDDIDTINMEVN